MSDVEDMLKDQEGSGPYTDDTFFPYVDSVGKVTIGYGHNLTDKGVRADLATMLFRGDIADAIEDVRHCFSCYDALSRPRQLCLISMAFNLGRVGLSKWPRFIGAVHLGKWSEAADELLDSKAATQAPTRYKQLATMMRENVSDWI